MTRARQIPELDTVRVLTFACVIAVHTIAHTTSGSSVAANAPVILLHFTREAFFCLTGFVLIHQYGRRHVDLGRFYRRRLLLVGVPYVVWTLIYDAHDPARLPQDLLFGGAWYHLYFLLVSLQIYAIFPLLAWLIRATEGHHSALLGVTGAIQGGLLWTLRYDPPTATWAQPLLHHQDALLLSYPFWVVLGAVAAWHADDILAWLSGHRRVVGLGVVAAAGAAELAYAASVHGGRPASSAAAVMQPVMLLWSTAAVVGLLALATVTRRADAFMRTASDRSFGVFLIHPAVLWLVLQVIPRSLPALSLTVIAYLLTVAGSVAAVELLRRSPLSLPLTGRDPLRKTVKGESSCSTYPSATKNPATAA